MEAMVASGQPLPGSGPSTATASGATAGSAASTPAAGAGQQG